MNKIPVVSIVGRQNVGKSTLFNALIKEKKAIVDSFPGLTRDIISFNVVYNSINFVLMDTPGLDLHSSSELSTAILENAMNYLKNSSIIIFLLENPEPASYDIELADIIRKLNIPTIIAVNKMDSNHHMENMINFYEMGFTDIVPISALNRYNLPMLFDKIIELLPFKKTAIKEPDLKISIVGRPNSGKSTLLNTLIGFNRAIVSDIPGTTRDSVDEDFTYHKKLIKVIDTAGIRKKSKITESVEYYSLNRTIEAIKKSDVVIHLIDATVGLTENDKKISDEIINAKKPIIIAINKWDAVEKDDKTFEEFKSKLIFKFYKADDFPIITISAKNKQRLNKILDTALLLQETAKRRIETAQLNKIMTRLQDNRKIPQLGEKIRIYYATQIDTVPPQFKLFVNNPDLFRKETIRYFEKSLQKELDLKGIPVILYLEGKKRTRNAENKPKTNSKMKTNKPTKKAVKKNMKKTSKKSTKKNEKKNTKRK